MKSQEDTSVKPGGDTENDSTQTEPIEERCAKGGRKKGETKSILEERHKARLEEQERKLIEEGVRRSQRIKDRNDANLIMEIDHYIPENFKEAMDSGERNEWHKAMEEELREIEKHKVWTLVPRENGIKVINSKWVYSTKKTPSDGIYKRKARLVAVGCNQRYGVDYKESFSPVLKKESLRTIVALATQQNLTIKTYDVKTAYLYGKCWNKKINEILYQLGMIRTKCDPCVYKLQRGEEYAILGLYVDDLIIAGTSKEINDNLASEIEKYVTLTEKKESEPFIGIEIKREEDGFYLSQTHYIDTILHRFGLEEFNSVQTPGDQNQNLDEYLYSKPVDKTVYQEMIGSLMYLLRVLDRTYPSTSAIYHSILNTIGSRENVLQNKLSNILTEIEDQRIFIKFCVKNGFEGAKIFWMLQTAYGDTVMSRRRVFEWYKRFKEGREETADNECSGIPSTSTTPEKVDKVLELVREDRRITVRKVADEAGISFGSTQSIIKDILGVRRLNAVLVPKDLTFDQKNARKETASLNLEATADDPELLKRGIVHHEFQQGSTITAVSYLGVLRRLREAIRQKRPVLWRSKSWILHHDNAPAHTALKISMFLQDHSTSVFTQPPYSPDLAPCDFFLFGKLKKKVKGSEISEHKRDQSGIEEGHEGDPENRLPEVFCQLEKRWLK
ncbi:hypothetical protein LAZ67_4003889 [Cordylochernes scorpioides]|uniref:Reverse transcriptase Ty1/copia-type domain-containing protein n=1 Tax=Cordylochernes scorpioides TaxID=51811 RepID=A0ABY6KE99_9ARAC|nr:hypothetical protein LAZ67_4003889 [Cordylochernes scorpioides]